MRRVQDTLQNGFKRSGRGAKYFSNYRRGEGAELQNDLNSGSYARQKSALKRIIANMTLGREVSFLFASVVKLSQTTNMELKKLVYLYVLSTANLQSDKAIMAVNTFLQDAANTSPIVRALAIRSMMCIRVPTVIEYTVEPLRRAVVDSDAYVRKTAAIGLGKLFHYNRAQFYELDLMPELVKLLSDSSAMVVSNAAAVVCEVNEHGERRVKVGSIPVTSLLDKLSDSTEWGQQYILELLSTVRVANTESAENLVSLVLPRLVHSNPAVVMAAIKVIANQHYKCTEELIERLTMRINAALLTLARSDAETQFLVCKNAHALLVIFPDLLHKDISAFFVRFNDPPFVKVEKLRLLLKLVTTATAQKVVKELGEYAKEVDVLFVEEVIRSIATLALKMDSVAPACRDLLAQLLQRRPELLPHIITAAMHMVRKHPQQLLLAEIIAHEGTDTLDETEAKVSLVWMLGEYGDRVSDGEALLDHFVASFVQHETAAQLAIVTAVIKSFLRDPGRREGALQQVLTTATQHSDDLDLRDRAFAYWRLLSKGIEVEQMRSIVVGHMDPVNVERTFSDAMTLADLKQSINTAAVVFGAPHRTFVGPYGLHCGEEADNYEEDDDDGDKMGQLEEGEKTNGDGAAATESTVQNDYSMNEPDEGNHNNVDASTDLFASSTQEDWFEGRGTTTGGDGAADGSLAQHSDPLDSLFGRAGAQNEDVRQINQTGGSWNASYLGSMPYMTTTQSSITSSLAPHLASPSSMPAVSHDAVLHDQAARYDATAPMRTADVSAGMPMAGLSLLDATAAPNGVTAVQNELSRNTATESSMAHSSKAIDDLFG